MFAEHSPGSLHCVGLLHTATGAAFSMWHVGSQRSPASTLPSSHSSPGSRTPSPHAASPTFTLMLAIARPLVIATVAAPEPTAVITPSSDTEMIVASCDTVYFVPSAGAVISRRIPSLYVASTMSRRVLPGRRSTWSPFTTSSEVITAVTETLSVTGPAKAMPPSA